MRRQIEGKHVPDAASTCNGRQLFVIKQSSESESRRCWQLPFVQSWWRLPPAMLLSQNNISSAQSHLLQFHNASWNPNSQKNLHSQHRSKAHVYEACLSALRNNTGVSERCAKQISSVGHELMGLTNSLLSQDKATQPHKIRSIKPVPECTTSSEIL